MPSFKFCWMWICPWIKLSWSSCSMWNKLGWLNWSWQILCKGYLPLIRKDSITHRLGLAVYVKEELLFARDLSLENSVDSYLCVPPDLLHSVSYFFSSINHCLCFYAQFLMLFHLTQMSFFRSAHLLIYLYLDTLKFIIRTNNLFWWNW